jgi:hypothetical protein
MIARGGKPPSGAEWDSDKV